MTYGSSNHNVNLSFDISQKINSISKQTEVPISEIIQKLIK